MSQTTTTVVQFPNGQSLSGTPTPTPTPAPSSPPTPTPLQMTPDKMVEVYIGLRDKVAEIKERHKDELARPTLAMAKLEGMMLELLNTSNLQSMSAKAGTFYKTTMTSCSVTEWHKTLDWIREHDVWELLEARVSKTAAASILKETGECPPGVHITTAYDVNVRRK